jgi:hypothetical protein
MVACKKSKKRKYTRPIAKVHKGDMCADLVTGKVHVSPAEHELLEAASAKAVKDIQEEEDKRILKMLNVAGEQIKWCGCGGFIQNGAFVHAETCERLLVTEKVDHPMHYGGKDNPYEAIKVIEAWNLGFHLGNTVKYISRMGKKSSEPLLQDAMKAKWYLDRYIEFLNKEAEEHKEIE